MERHGKSIVCTKRNDPFTLLVSNCAFFSLPFIFCGNSLASFSSESLLSLYWTAVFLLKYTQIFYQTKTKWDMKTQVNTCTTYASVLPGFRKNFKENLTSESKFAKSILLSYADAFTIQNTVAPLLNLKTSTILK